MDHFFGPNFSTSDRRIASSLHSKDPSPQRNPRTSYFHGLVTKNVLPPFFAELRSNVLGSEFLANLRPVVTPIPCYCFSDHLLSKGKNRYFIKLSCPNNRIHFESE